MPRSFLLRRSVQGDAKSDNEAKMQSKARKRILPRPEENNDKHIKRSYGGIEKKIIWSNEEKKIDAKATYMYQSYIDGDMIKKDNDFVKEDFLLSSTDKEDIARSQLENLNTKASKPKLDREIQESRDIPASTPGMKPIYRCEQCGKTFKTKYTLTIHLKMPNHTGARPFVCNICGKGFRLSSTLCRHKIIHTSDKPHKCHICQKAFNRSSTLKTHIRTHSEKKEFVCDVCGKGFHQKGNLRNHFLIHTGEKPYNCRLCNKAFNKLSNLKFHLHVHTDNTPYRCRYCKTAFSRRFDLKQHIQNTHGEEHNDYNSDSDEM